MPDITDKENVKRLLNWDGGVGGMTQISMTRKITMVPVAIKKTEDAEMKE